MIIDGLDLRPSAGCGLHHIADQREIDLVIGARIARRVHELNRQIDSLARRIGLFGRHDVFFAQHRRAALDQQTSALIVVCDDAFADDDTLAGL